MKQKDRISIVADRRIAGARAIRGIAWLIGQGTDIISLFIGLGDAFAVITVLVFAFAVREAFECMPLSLLAFFANLLERLSAAILHPYFISCTGNLPVCIASLLAFCFA